MLRFAVHRLGNPIAFPRSHGVPRRDVPCRVHVSVKRETTGCAPESGLALARLPVHMPAHAAALARKRGAYLVDSARGLIVQAADQQSPSRREDLPVQSGLLAHSLPEVLSGRLGAPNHVLDAQILDADQIEPASQVSADPLTPVLPGIRLAGLEAGDGNLGFRSAVAAAFRVGQPALQQTQTPLTRLTQPRTAQQFTIRQGRAYGYAAVHADDLTCSRTWDGLGDRGEGQMPSASMVQGDPERLHAAGDGAGPAESDPTALGDEHFPDIPVQLTHIVGLDRDDTEPFVASSLAPRRPAMGTCEEISHGLVKVAERLLLHHLAATCQPNMLPPRGGELPALLQVPWRTCPSRTPPRLLLTGEVPHEPCLRTMFPQHCLVGSRREQAVAGHTKTLSSITDIPEEVKRRALPLSWQRTSAPRTR
jgi:hypothetical protein